MSVYVYQGLRQVPPADMKSRRGRDPRRLRGAKRAMDQLLIHQSSMFQISVADDGFHSRFWILEA